MYEFAYTSRRPNPIVTYDTLTYSFDYYIWGFSVAFTFAAFVILATFQKTWSYVSGEKGPDGWLFQGI